MKFINPLVLIFMVVMSSSCYAEIIGKVADAETGQPVEGAIVLVQWTKTKGMPGMIHHEVDKIVEVETDKEGRFSIAEKYNPLINTADIVIYKDGYVAWRNDIIFPGWTKRKDFKLNVGIVIKLETFKEGFSRYDHCGFMNHGIIGANIEQTPKFSKALNAELQKALSERGAEKNK